MVTALKMTGMAGILITIIVCLSIFLDENVSLYRESVHYVPPFKFIKLISGTFQSFWADIFYIRGIMAITGKFENREERTYWVQQNLKLATDLDPELLQAYFFGGIVLGRTEKTIRMGIKFLKEALIKRPSDWHIFYWIGFSFYELGDYSLAIKYYKKASDFPDAPEYLKSNQPMLYYKAGKPDLGISYLEGLLHSVKDSKQLEWIKVKLEWLRNISFLEKKVKEFEQIYSRPPENLQEMVAKGILDKIPQDPFLGGYYLDKNSGRIKSRPKPFPYYEGTK